MLTADAVTFRSDDRDLVANAALQLHRGEVLAILGPNGAGKSTLLKLLARELRPSSGRIEFNGRPLASWTPLELARQRAVLPQGESLRFAFTVRQVVELGRYPWNGGRPSDELRIVDEAMRVAGVDRLAPRCYPTLSGGERARVQLARVLAQIWDPSPLGGRLLLLDEPTASLDLSHQHEVLTAVRTFAATDAAVILVVHDLNLALRYADRVLLMKDGVIDSAGPAQEILDPAAIQRVFNVDVELLQSGVSGQTWIAPRPRTSGADGRTQN